MLKIDPSDAIPIWKQIEEGVRHLIATGTLRPDDPLVSVRELARDLRINPLTVSKAYRRLADLGVLVVRRGEGTFVAPTPPTMGREERREKLFGAARRFVNQAMSLSADVEESVDAIREVWRRLAPAKDGGTEKKGTADETNNSSSGEGS